MFSELSQQARYIFSLIGLLLLVVAFGVSVYFYTGEGQELLDDTGTEKTEIEAIKDSVDFVGVFRGNDKHPEYIQLSQNQSPNYNPRDPDTRKTYGDSLILRYFQLLNSGDFTKACSLLSLDQCNSRRSIIGFSNFPKTLLNGYENISVYKADKTENEEIFCVKYQYKLKQDTNPNPIIETMQFRISLRPDNLDEISARVCEAKKKGDRTPPCPVVPPKTYCI